MLAYVFWHWKRDGASTEAYEKQLRAFHRALTAAPSQGFQRSAAYAISGAPWAAGGADAFEDWYHVTGSADLDPLDAAAISASRQVPHDTVAALAAGGTAGLYRLKDGSPTIAPRYAWWFSKPGGMRYPDLYATLAPLCSAGRAALWCRQMTLGPATEFCLQAPQMLELPPAFSTRRVDLRQIYP